MQGDWSEYLPGGAKDPMNPEASGNKRRGRSNNTPPSSGPWAGSNRRDELPSDWKKIRGRILARDGYQCTHVRYDTGRRCTETLNLEVDHIGDKDDHDPANLRVLCRYHHGQRTARQGAEGRRRQARPTRRRPSDDHPSAL
jgi:5-methylcytosine-specific restriction protein A